MKIFLICMTSLLSINSWAQSNFLSNPSLNWIPNSCGSSIYYPTCPWYTSSAAINSTCYWDVFRVMNTNGAGDCGLATTENSVRYQGYYINSDPQFQQTCAPAPRTPNNYGSIMTYAKNYYYYSASQASSVLYQSMSVNLLSGKSYQFSIYCKPFDHNNGVLTAITPTTSELTSWGIGVKIVPTVGGNTFSPLMNNIINASFPVQSINLDQNGWYLIKGTFTPNVTGFYTFCAGALNFCVNSYALRDDILLQFDDALLNNDCYSNAGVDKSNLTKPGCNPSCTSVIIGTPAVSGFSYQWTPNNGTLNNVGIAQPTASPCTSTNYTLTVTSNSGACLSNKDVMTVSTFPGSSCTPGGNRESVQLENESKFNITPNPFSISAIITIESDLVNAELFIFDILGNTLDNKKNISGKKVEIERANMKAGVYFYRIIENGSEISNGKFVIVD